MQSLVKKTRIVLIRDGVLIKSSGKLIIYHSVYVFFFIIF